MQAPRITPLIFSTDALVAALAKFDETEPTRQRFWDAIDNQADVGVAEQMDRDALALVQEAFYEATKDRNNRADCAHVSLDFMRRMANS